jgi:ribonuclease D
MSSPQLPPPKLVNNNDLLHALVNKLSSQPRIAVDSESNSLYAYQEQVCLIQFSIPGKDYLVDPIALSGMSTLAPIFANPEIEKVFHGAEYDIACLKRDFGFTFINLFDTRVASRTLGRKHSGLRAILADELGVELNKRFQRANWGKRPLTSEMLDYARLDTHYLLLLRDHLAEALHTAGVWEETREACDYLTKVDAHNNIFDPEGYWRISNASKLTPRQVAVLRELYLYRDQQARRLDRPPFKVLGDKTLLAIAHANPVDIEEFIPLPGMTSRQIQRFGEDLLLAVSRGHRAHLPRRPSYKPYDEEVHSRYEALRAWRKKVARLRNVESDVILPRDILWDIARAAPRDAKSLQKVMSPLECRFQTYGQEIIKTLWN